MRPAPRAGYAPRPSRFVRRLKRLAIGTVVTFGILVVALFEAQMILHGIDWLKAQEQAHVERVARARVAQECGRAP